MEVKTRALLEWWSLVKREEGSAGAALTAGWWVGHSVESGKPLPPLGRSVVPHTGFEWHSVLSKVPEFPPVQLALYPSLPLLDPSCTLSTGRKNTKDCREEHTSRPGQNVDRRQQHLQALLLDLLAQSHQVSKQKKPSYNLIISSFIDWIV